MTAAGRGEGKQVSMIEVAEINVEKHAGKMTAVTSTALPWIQVCGIWKAFP
jgi:hypothetical protein